MNKKNAGIVYLYDGIGNASIKQNNANVWFDLRSIHERLKSWDSSAGAFTPIGSKLVGQNIYNFKVLSIYFDAIWFNSTSHEVLFMFFANSSVHCWDTDYPLLYFGDNLTSKKSRNLIIIVTWSYLKLGKGIGKYRCCYNVLRYLTIKKIKFYVFFTETRVLGSIGRCTSIEHCYAHVCERYWIRHPHWILVERLIQVLYVC